MYIEPKCGKEKMEVLFGDEQFIRLVEEYMGPDARRYLDWLFEEHGTTQYNKGYEDGYEDGYVDGY